MKIKCGFVAVVGKPNAGKSSLVNAIIKEKVSIVSPKPQTTRNNILGIYNSDHSQIVFVDTPGINKTSTGLDKFMQKSIKGAVSDVNAVIIVCDITKGVDRVEIDLVEKYNKENIPVVLVLSKIDLVEDEVVFKTLQQLSLLATKCEIVPLSSIKGRNVDTVVEVVEKFLPEVDERNKYFDDDEYTDKPLNFLVAEIVREKALYYLDREIPHGIAVVTQRFEEDENLIDIDVDIVCDKISHKAIILGKQGTMLKKIGHDARVTIQKIVQKKVMLNIFVKVKPNWKNNLEFLDSLGYNINEL